MWTKTLTDLNPTCLLKQEELPGFLVRKELKQVRLPKVKQDDCGSSQYFTPDKTNPSFKNPVLQILRCVFRGGGPPASSSFDLLDLHLIWSNSRGWLKPCSRALVAQAKYKGAFFLLSLPLYKSPCRNQNQVAKASTWGLWEVLGIMYLSGRRNAWHQWQTGSERGEKKKRPLAKGNAEMQSQWSCTSYAEYSDHHKMHLWRHQKVPRFACVSENHVGETDRPHRTLKNSCEISQQHQTVKMTTMSTACSSAAFCSTTLKTRQQRFAPGHADR